MDYGMLMLKTENLLTNWQKHFGLLYVVWTFGTIHWSFLRWTQNEILLQTPVRQFERNNKGQGSSRDA